MARWKLTIEYDGTDFVGWQRQANGLAVQQAVEEAIFAFCAEQCVLHAAGRTDAGVHAFGQVAHVDIVKQTDANTIRNALNFYLRMHRVSILSVEAVGADFHARFSAIQRAYLYRILDRRPPPAIDRGRVWWIAMPLDVEAMNAAAQLLPGQRDFSTFRAADCQADGPVKTLDVLTAMRVGEEIHVRARARSFLYHQVRNMVGSLKFVGEGKWSLDEFKRARDAADRTQGGPTAPPEGLYLTDVVYPPLSRLA
jgi:tRNA pseudouridine38-40 synthase